MAKAKDKSKNSDKVDFTLEWNQYQAGINYNNSIGYKSVVDKNERFYSGNQWQGVKSDNLPVPVFNMLKRITDSKVSYILSQPFKIRYSGVKGDVTDETGAVIGKQDGIGDVLSSAAAYHWEKDNLDYHIRNAVLNGALTGDMCAYVYWDPSLNEASAVKGDYTTEVIDGINVYFGNVNDNRVQTQPYIIVSGRTMTEFLKQEGKKEGLPQSELDKILPDGDNENQAGDRSATELDNSQKTTYIIKFFKENGKVYFTKSTKSAVIIRKRDTGLTLYPIAWGNWILRKNSYHGEAEITHMLSTQLYFNKQMALAQKSLMDTAFPTTVYDKTRVAGWSNAVGQAVPTQGSVENVARVINGGQMDGGVMAILDRTLDTLYQSAGITDALTGEMRPENTSAIIVLQKAASTALDMQRAAVSKFIEDIAKIWLDFMRSKYVGGKTLYINTEDGLEPLTVDSNIIKEMVIRTRIDVGASTMWSETLAVETLSGMLSNGLITPKQFLERMPRGVIPKTDELIADIQRMETAAAAEQPDISQLSELPPQTGLPDQSITGVQDLSPLTPEI